ncbi:glycoside hydrolase family 2 protein [Niallia endozanthoxylica]|uniref:Glycoside hydrolase family 2 protein n=1 Tax=Niallia endozanthoxylica TaxID=2036016 RepID=A0A5J5HU74_9BACI|nr:sugar-binding domain-containing protein [Niallia endozanthoxylica]KAA9023907.1 glycoside hydrolase family 2 protein [Niallia endozanthoxylica]
MTQKIVHNSPSHQIEKMKNQHKFNLNTAWKFIKEDVNEASNPHFDDSNWETVSLPHTFNDKDTFDNFMEGGHNGERSMYTGKTWYRKTFQLEEIDKGKKVFIEFEGARQAADVYINGKKLEGKSENGFIPFGYDLTPYIHFGTDKENVLAVMVDNTFPYKAEGTDDVLSWHDSHWHPTHGGLWRNVYLHLKDKLHITLPLYSFLKTQGTYVYASDITDNTATITVEAEVANEYDTAKQVDCVSDVFDRDGNIVLSMKDTRIVEAGKKILFRSDAQMKHPHRWSPQYPYVYTVKTKLYTEGELTDDTETPLGIRTFEFTSDQGFFINGQPLKLKGWGQRPTNEWAGLGAAYPNWMHGFMFDLMKDAGGNFIRWGHSAGAPVDIELADKYGLITIQPGVDGEGSTVGGVYSDVAYKIRAQAFRDMIIYFRNHPSILIWEGGNQSVPEPEAKTLRAIADTWDPNGMRAYAHRRSNLTMADYIDVSIGTEGSWELKSKGKPIVEGEYNREEAARRVWDRYTPGYENYETSPGSAYNLTSEEFAKNQAKHFEKISHPAHCGGANWIFSDSTSHGRVYSEVSRVSGQVDGVMLPKEAFFTTKTIYREDPQVHIIGHWNYKEGTVKDIYVMSNADEVELFVNGVSQGFGSKSHSYLFTFEKIHWESGTIKALAYNQNKEGIAVQEKKTTGEAAAVKLTPITGPEGFKANGSDIVLLDAEVVDADGNRVPIFEGHIDFTIEGPAIWRGGYNSGKEGSTNHTYLDIEAGINRVAIRSTLTVGVIQITAVVDGLKTDSISVESIPVPIEHGLSTELPSLQEGKLGEEPPIGNGPSESSPLAETEAEESQLITDFSYSGIEEVGGVKGTVNIGDRIFIDREYEFQFLMEPILGSDYIQLANNEKNYKALDLIHFTVTKEADVYIAHDDRLSRPEWLLEDFNETKRKVIVDETLHTVFQQTVQAGTTLTLGGNQDETNETNCNMYVVFVKETVS